MEEIISISLVYFLWIVYSCLEGFREAYYYHLNMIIPNKLMNLHPIFAAQRFIVSSVICILAFTDYHSLLNSLLFLLSLGLSFPFFHDGMYYLTRNNLDNNLYKDKWFDQSESSTALTDKFKLLTPNKRIAYFAVGLAILIYTFIK